MTTTTNTFANNLGGKAYDRFYDVNIWCPGLELEVGNMVAHHLDGRDGRVIDIGSGTGDTIAAILAAGCSAEIFGVDVVEKMVEVAKERFANVPQVTLVLADALGYLQSLESGSVEAVASGFCLHNLENENRAAIMAEVFRVLVPGGLFVQCDKVALDDRKDHVESLTQQLMLFDGFSDDPEYRVGWVRHYALDDQPGIRISESEWTTLLKNLGFHSIAFKDRTLMDNILSAMKP